MGKIVTIQWLRAIACILVVWTHAMRVVSEQGLGSFQTQFGYLDRFGSVGVDIFFVISGFIVTLSAQRYRSVLAFLGERLIRIWPLYVVATLLYLVADPAAVSEPTLLIISLTFIQPPGPINELPTLPQGWTLMFEMWFYAALCAAMAWKSPREIHEKVTILVVGAILGGALFGFIRPFNVIGNPLAIEFLAGVWIAYLYGKGKKIPQWLCSALFVVGTLSLLWTIVRGETWICSALEILRGPLGWDRVRIWGIGSALIVASAVFRSQPTKSAGLLALLGDASYSIYLFHAHAIEGLKLIPWMADKMSPDIMIIVSTAIATGFGVMCYFGIEKPLIRWFKARRGSIVGAEAIPTT